MRFLIFTLALVAAVPAIVWHLSRDIPMSDTGPGAALHSEGTDQSPAASIGLIVDLERYDDPDYGFSLAIPVGWTRIVAADSDADTTEDVLATLEPGYAVGFESPRIGRLDQFADYILIEVLPGSEFGLFESAPEHRLQMEFDSQVLAYDRLLVDSESDDNAAVDLVIFQYGMQGVGYTVAFYAIGEPANEQAMFDAFQIMLRTFTQTTEPFVVI